MPQKHDRPAAKPFAVNVLTITAITLACLLAGAYVVYKIVVGGVAGNGAPLPVPHPPAAMETTVLGTTDYSGILNTLDGTPVAMSSFVGKVIFLNFWASWCPPCIAELPNIQRLYRTTGGDIVFLLVSTEAPEDIRAFMHQRNYDFPVYIAERSLLDAFGVTAFPATYVLGRGGRILFKHMGAARWDDPAFVRYLRNLAQNPS